MLDMYRTEHNLPNSPVAPATQTSYVPTPQTVAIAPAVSPIRYCLKQRQKLLPCAAGQVSASPKPKRTKGQKWALVGQVAVGVIAATYVGTACYQLSRNLR